jgi:hypothetical protein
MRAASSRHTSQARNQALHDSLWRLEHGFSAAITLVVIASLSLVLTALGTALALAQFQVKLQLTADASALVAADTMLGAVAGYPCENAQTIALADGAFLSSCRIVGLGAVVQATQNFGIFEVSRWAEAGPQSGTN